MLLSFAGNQLQHHFERNRWQVWRQQQLPRRQQQSPRCQQPPPPLAQVLLLFSYLFPFMLTWFFRLRLVGNKRLHARQAWICPTTARSICLTSSQTWSVGLVPSACSGQDQQQKIVKMCTPKGWRCKVCLRLVQPVDAQDQESSVQRRVLGTGSTAWWAASPPGRLLEFPLGRVKLAWRVGHLLPLEPPSLSSSAAAIPM